MDLHGHLQRTRVHAADRRPRARQARPTPSGRTRHQYQPLTFRWPDARSGSRRSPRPGTGACPTDLAAHPPQAKAASAARPSWRAWERVSVAWSAGRTAGRRVRCARVDAILASTTTAPGAAGGPRQDGYDVDGRAQLLIAHPYPLSGSPEPEV